MAPLEGKIEGCQLAMKNEVLLSYKVLLFIIKYFTLLAIPKKKYDFQSIRLSNVKKEGQALRK